MLPFSNMTQEGQCLVPAAQGHLCITHLPQHAPFRAEHILAVPVPGVRPIYTSFPDTGSAIPTSI